MCLTERERERVCVCVCYREKGKKNDRTQIGEKLYAYQIKRRKRKMNKWRRWRVSKSGLVGEKGDRKVW